jgi:hypothetical protein
VSECQEADLYLPVPRGEPRRDRRGSRQPASRDQAPRPQTKEEAYKLLREATGPAAERAQPS